MSKTSVPQLIEYMDVVHLNERFKKDFIFSNKAEDREPLVDDILTYLLSEKKMDMRFLELSFDEKRKMLDGLLTVREVRYTSEAFHQKVDRLLQWESAEREIVDISEIASLDNIFGICSLLNPSKIFLWKGDITCLRVDAIVNAANSHLIGCFIPFHNCIDNAIHSKSGTRLREDCRKLIELQGAPENLGTAKITRAYNLPSKYVLHTVGPTVKDGKVTTRVKSDLVNCYRSCLELASRVEDIKSIAFCSISTGQYRFPIEIASKFAVREVDIWLKKGGGHVEQVVFNVFSDHDYTVYADAIKTYQSC